MIYPIRNLIFQIITNCYNYKNLNQYATITKTNFPLKLILKCKLAKKCVYRGTKTFFLSMINFSLIHTSDLFGNNLIPTATSSGLSTSFLRENIGKSNLSVGGTMPKMSMSLLRETNNRYF